MENLWHYLRSHYLSNRSYADYDALLDAGTEAYRKLTPEVIQVGLPMRLHRRRAELITIRISSRVTLLVDERHGYRFIVTQVRGGHHGCARRGVRLTGTFPSSPANYFKVERIDPLLKNPRRKGDARRAAERDEIRSPQS